MEQAIYIVFSDITYKAESFDLIPVSFMFRSGCPSAALRIRPKES